MKKNKPQIFLFSLCFLTFNSQLSSPTNCRWAWLKFPKFFAFLFLILTVGGGSTLNFVYAGTGTSSANFLQENLSARQVGMGGVSCATTEDSNSIQSNPAGLSLMNRPELNLSYAATQDNSYYAFTAYAHPIMKNPPFQFGIGAGVLYYSAGNMDINYLDGTTKSFNAEKSYAGTLSLGARIQKWFAFGLSPKFVRSTLVEQFTATAFGVDAGIMIFPFPSVFKENVILGGTIQNLGQQMTYKTVSHDLPYTELAGIGIRFWDNEEFGSAIGSLQTERVVGEKWRFRLGGEYALGGQPGERIFFLRAGYRVHFESEDYSIGVGIREKNLQLDYAFVNGIELEKTHRFTLLFRFGKPPAKKKETVKHELIDVNEEIEGKSSDNDYQLIPLPNKEKPSTSEYQLVPQPKK